MKKKLIKIIAFLAIIASFGGISTSSDAASDYIYKTKVYCWVTDGYKTPDGKFFKLLGAEEGVSAFGYGRPDYIAEGDGKVLDDWIRYMYNYDPEEYWFMRYLFIENWNNIMYNKDKNGRLKEDLYDEQGNYLTSPGERIEWYDRNIYPKYIETLDKYRVEHVGWTVTYDEGDSYSIYSPELSNKDPNKVITY